MNEIIPPLLLEPAALSEMPRDGLIIVDLCKPELYAQAHIPGAVHLDYRDIVASIPPVNGLLPDPAHLASVLGPLGITPDHHVVACDDEGGGRASRLLWTLMVAGYPRLSLLNGGIHAWAAERLPLTSEPPIRRNPELRSLHAHYGHDFVADRGYIKQRLGATDYCLLDARTPAEFSGEKKLAARGGHIPGAVNFDWVRALDTENQLRLRPIETLRTELVALGVTPEREIIAYCQSHHRSALLFVLLRALGYPRVRGYPGSWSEWGNLPE